MDEDLRNRVLNILEEEQKQLENCLSPQSTVTSPETITVIESERDENGQLQEKVTYQPSNYVNVNIDSTLRSKFETDADTLREFCKIVDDKIISINSEINFKKQQIATLSVEATNGNCWAGIAYSSLTIGGSTPDLSGVTQNYSTPVTLNDDIENIRIYPYMAGPDVRYDVKNPFEPDSIYTLTSLYSGYGYKNLQDPLFYKNKDGSLTGLSTDGSGNNIGYGRFDISTTLSDHQARNVGFYRWYPGAGVAPYATDTGVTASRCVSIASSISSIYNEIIELRKERDSLRSDLNTIKDNKKEKELSAWGVQRINHQIDARSTKNISAISAVRAFDSNVTVNVDALVLSLDVGDPDSYSGIGTTWYDLSGNGNNATLFPTGSPAEYVFSDGGFLSFNGTDEYAQTGIKTTNILGAGTTFTIETWFRVNGVPSDTGYANAIVDVNAQSTSTNMLGVSYGQNGIFAGIATNRLIYTASSGIGTTTLVGAAVTSGSWYHGVVVRNSTTNTKLYLNGVNVATYTGDVVSGAASTTSVKISTWTDETVYSNVSSSVVKIYQKSYTDDEIRDKFYASKSRYGIVG